MKRHILAYVPNGKQDINEKGEHTLPHNNTTHKHLNRPNPLQRHLALTSSLVQTQLMSQLILAHGTGVVDLVSENKEGDLGELLHGQEGVQLGLGLEEPLVVAGVDQEDDAADFGEVVLPETAGCVSSVLRLCWREEGRDSPCW